MGSQPLDRDRLRHLLEFRFRANPAYRLYPYERLRQTQQDELRELARDPGFYGLLLAPEEPRLGTKSVDCETALLFLTLQEPGVIPGFVCKRHGAEANRDIAQLVLDGVLEVEHADRFSSGAEAYALLYRDASREAPCNRLGRLSERALRYGQQLGLRDPAQLSARLYHYNTVPVSPRWRRLLDSAGEREAALGLTPEGATRRQLDAAYRLRTDDQGWYYWISQTPAGRYAGGGVWKLYLSPRPEHLAEVLSVAARVFTRFQVPQFKLGADAPGLLRPDKLVAYLTGEEQLQAVAGELEQQLEGCAAQGVPFTAELGREGLISWGIDPPAGAAIEGWQGRESWRLWLTDRLAWALVRGQQAPDLQIEPWQYALDRLELEGVDTHTWTPPVGRFETEP